MGETEGIQPTGERLKKAVKWISETLRDFPSKSRKKIIEEAEIRFDLTPKECDFLNRHFCNEE